ncbi:MAG: glycosyltransferase family 4 protein [Nitrospinae bacterium]|nr:glycosyltransferase family 4 protein [Nitrospinota bacterium]
MGGHEAYVHAQANALAMQGHRLTVATAIKEVFSPWPKELGHSIQYITHETLHKFLDGQNTYERRSRRNKDCPLLLCDPDIVFTHGGVDPWIIKKLARVLPTIHFVHSPGDYCPSGTKYHPKKGQPCHIRPSAFQCLTQSVVGGCFFDGGGNQMGVRLMSSLLGQFQMKRRLVYPAVQAIVAQSHYVVDELKMIFEKTPHLNSKIFVLSPPLPLATLPYKPQWQESQGSNQLLFVGRLHSTKGVEDLIQALQFLPDGSKLTIVGDGPQRRFLERLAQELCAPQTVRFVGWVEQARLRKLYLTHTLLLLPSRWPEPFGLVGVEAMAHGLPVIAYDVGGISGWLEPSRGGYLVEPGNVQALARVIEQAFQNPDEMDRKSAEGQAYIKAHFCPEAYLKRLEKIIEQAMGNFHFDSRGFRLIGSAEQGSVL